MSSRVCLEQRLRRGIAVLGLLACAFVTPDGEARADASGEQAQCGIFFGEDSCPAQIPSDEATRVRVRTFCGGLKEAADVVLSGARPGFRIQSGEDMWEGDVNEQRVMWGNVIGRGIYDYDARESEANRRYELSFFFPGVSVAELEEGLNVCPAFFQSVTGNPSTAIVFRRRSNEGALEVLVRAEVRRYNSQARAFESGARLSLVRQ